MKSKEKINKLTFIRNVPKEKRRDKRIAQGIWKCECGNIKKIDIASVKSGNTKSCGCLFKDWSKNQPSGKDSPCWKGGRRVEDGYVLVYKKNHVHAKKNGYVREHRYVMSEHLGRPLDRNENVHHINGDRQDNRIENLELWNTSQPSGQRVEDKLLWAEEIIKKYKKNE